MKQTAIEQSMILLVDDTPENLDILVDTLERQGFQLCVAKNGEAVFDRLKHIRPDLILLDVLMPGMDGFEVCRRLKAAPDTQDIPVLFMTALPDVVDKVKGFEAGAVDYITKPFQQEEVLARIKAQLTIRKLQRELNEALVRRSKRQLEELRANISRSVPHELGTPLNIILGFAGMILNSHESMSKAMIVEQVRSIYEAAERLHKLTQKYLAYAYIEIVAADPERASIFRDGITVNPAVNLASAAKYKASRAQRCGDLALACDVAAAACTIRISEKYFEMIAQELLENAFKFSRAGTPVRLTAAVTGQQLILSVSDQGRGMTAEQIANVGAYMQFERALYEQQGAGLGLIIAKRLVELHQGAFTVTSAGKDQGVTCVAALPLK